MNTANRRVFLTQAAALSCGVLWNDSTMAKTLTPALAAWVSESQLSGKSLLAKMKWLNERVDSGNWLKCGLELVDGIGHASVVVTREFSDWSTVRGITTKDPLRWRIVRKGSSLEVLYSLDSKNFTSTRLGYLPLQAALDVGIMCCSPEGTGFESTFDEIRLAQ